MSMVNRTKSSRWLQAGILFLSALLVLIRPHQPRAASPGLPLLEDFSDTTLQDTANSTGDWSTEQQALLLRRAQLRFGSDNPWDGVTPSSISSDS